MPEEKTKMQNQTGQTKPKKPTLEIELESMEKIEDRTKQWMLLEEHWTQNNLNRGMQLDYAKSFFKEIMQEIKQAYKTCPAYSSG